MSQFYDGVCVRCINEGYTFFQSLLPVGTVTGEIVDGFREAVTKSGRDRRDRMEEKLNPCLGIERGDAATEDERGQFQKGGRGFRLGGGQREIEVLKMAVEGFPLG